MARSISKREIERAQSLRKSSEKPVGRSSKNRNRRSRPSGESRNNIVYIKERRRGTEAIGDIQRYDHKEKKRNIYQEKKSPEREAVKGGFKNKKASWLLALSFSLTAFGVLMIVSSSTYMAFELQGFSYYYAVRQLLHAGIGIVLMALAYLIGYKKIMEYSLHIYGLSLGLLVAVLFFGERVNGRKAWLTAGPVTFQPSYLALLFLVIVLADYYGRGNTESKTPLILGGVTGILILLEKDLGTFLLMTACLLVMMWLGGSPTRDIAALLSVFGMGTAVFIMFLGYAQDRISAFIDPWSDPMGTGYNVIQSLVGLGTGGLHGLGIGMSRQKFFYLPHIHNDFIFSVIGEEMGLMGTFSVLALFTVLVSLCFFIGKHSESKSASLVCYGLSFLIAMQAIINMGAATRLMPISGIPLPFMSYGGTSLVVSFIIIGIVMSISKNADSTGNDRKRNPRAQSKNARASRGRRDARR